MHAARPIRPARYCVAPPRRSANSMPPLNAANHAPGSLAHPIGRSSCRLVHLRRCTHLWSLVITAVAACPFSL